MRLGAESCATDGGIGSHKTALYTRLQSTNTVMAFQGNLRVVPTTSQTLKMEQLSRGRLKARSCTLGCGGLHVTREGTVKQNHVYGSHLPIE